MKINTPYIKVYRIFYMLIMPSIFMFSCINNSTTEMSKITTANQFYDTAYSVDTKGYWENGQIVTTFDCPDSRFFPPIDIKKWDKVPVVNGRLPTYKETLNGTSIHTYSGKNNSDVKPYNLALPVLAYYKNGHTITMIDSANIARYIS